MSLGTTIKKHRRHLQMTQEDLAKVLGLKRVTIATYERAQVKPSLPIIRHMAIIFECSLEELLEDDPLDVEEAASPAP